MASCKKQGATLAEKSQRKVDSTVLCVAIIPTLECLPVYYAQRCGIFDSIGLDIKIKEYQSQADADTALLYGHAQMEYTELPRVLTMRSQDSTLKIIAQNERPLCLVVAKTKRMSSIKQLRERLVGIDRLSISDKALDAVINEANLNTDEVFRPQINDLKLRTSMLISQILDAAILPYPYSYQAEQYANKILWQAPDSITQLACLVASLQSAKDTLKQSQMHKFLHAIELACDKINEGDKNDVCYILNKYYGIPKQMADTMPIPRILPPSTPSETEFEQSKHWLIMRNKTLNNCNYSSIIYRRKTKH